jgi:hypothetical protein
MFNHSCRVAHELDDVLDHVIAVDGTVSDAAMRQFSELFYQLIWHRRSYTYDRAFEVAISGPVGEQAAFTLLGCRVSRKIHPCARSLSPPRDVVPIDNPGRITD